MGRYKIPKLTGWNDFEDLCCEIWKNIWDDYNVQRVGRSGQRQNGVDIAFLSENGEMKVIQCKNVEKLTPKDIDDEIKKAQEFEPKICSLTFATSLDRDVKLTSHVLKKSQENFKKGLFEINIWFWEDICDELIKNRDLTKRFFREFFEDENLVSTILDNTLECFEDFNYSDVIYNLKLLSLSRDNFSQENKYKYLILEGKYYLLCNKVNEASENFIKAYQYSNKSIESEYFKALGLFYQGKFEKCNESLNKIFKEDSFNEKAYDLLLLNNMDLSFQEIKNLVPLELLDSPLINFRLGLIAYEKKEGNPMDYLIKVDVEHPINSINLNLVKLDIFYKEEKHLYLEYYDDLINELTVIEEALQSKIDVIPDEILKENLHWIINLTEINLLLKNMRSLNINLERALKIDPKNQKLLLNKSKFLFHIHETNDAVSILEDLIYIYPISFDVLSQFLFKQENYDKIINHGEKLIDNFKNEPEKILNCKLILINIYLLNNESDQALDLINSLKDSYDDFYYNLCLSRYYKDSEESYQFLLLCKNSMNDCNRREKLGLAYKFKLCNDLVSAIEIYEDVLDLNYYTTEIEFLLECYLDNEEYKKNIELCEKFISRGEYYPNLLKYLMHIYSMVHDYDNLKRISKLYLDNFENDLDIKYNLMRINLMEKNYSEIDSFILEEQDFSSLDLEQSMFFYYLCVIRGFSNEKLLNVLFDILLKNYENIKAHEFYVGEILKNKIEFGKYDMVEWDNAVFLKYPNKEEWKFFSNSSNVYPFDTISEDDELSKILGKTIGEKITLGYNEIEILDIQDKFYYCFRVSQSKIGDFGSKYVMPIYLDNPEDLKPIFKVIDNYSKRVEDITEYYKNKSIPIFLFSKLLGRDFIDSYNYLLKIGLNSFNENDLNKIRKKDKLVIDISSLLTIHYLNIENKLTEYYEFVTSYSTLFLLREIYQKTKTQFSNEGELVYKHKGNYYRSENNFENKLELVEKLINWVEKNCEYLPIYGLLELNSDLKNSINIIDEQFITDNILIAANENFLYLCDDAHVKRIAKEFNVKSLGVLNLIRNSYSKGFISENEYLSLTNTLYMNNFKKFYLKSSNIVYEIKNYNFLFISKILLNINEFDVNIINVLVETILKISNECIGENLLEFVINLILNSLKNNQEMYFLFLKKLFYSVNKIVY